jgi:hypothetical protein
MILRRITDLEQFKQEEFAAISPAIRALLHIVAPALWGGLETAGKRGVPEPLDSGTQFLSSSGPKARRDQRFRARLTVGMKTAKRKMMKAIQKATHPNSFTL